MTSQTTRILAAALVLLTCTSLAPSSDAFSLFKKKSATGETVEKPKPTPTPPIQQTDLFWYSDPRDSQKTCMTVGEAQRQGLGVTSRMGRCTQWDKTHPHSF